MDFGREMSDLKLKSKKIEIIVVDYGDFEEMVQKVYGQKDYSYVADVECGNDCEHLYGGINGRVSESEDADLKEFLETGQTNYYARILLEDLCRQKHINHGNYLIKVWW